MAHSLLDRGTSISLTLLLLLPALAAAAGPAPLGALRSSGTVYVDSTQVAAQSSLFNGDRVRTEEGRASLALPHGSSILFERSSTAVLQKTSGGISIGLEKGCLTYNSNPQAPILVKTGGMALLPTGKFPSLAVVAMLGDGSTTLAVHRGIISVRNAQEEPILVKAGESLTVGPQAVQQDETPGTAAHGSQTVGQKVGGIRLSHGASIAVIGAAVAATAAAVGIAIAANDDEPAASPSNP